MEESNDASPLRIPFRSVRPFPSIVEWHRPSQGRSGTRKAEKDKDKVEGKTKQNSEPSASISRNALFPDPYRGAGERKWRARQPRKLTEAFSAALKEMAAFAL